MTDEELFELPIIEARRLVRDEFTKRYLAALMKKTRGNVTHAAKQAKIDRTNLRRFMRELLRGDAA